MTQTVKNSDRLNDMLPHCECGARVDHAWPADHDPRWHPEYQGVGYEENARLQIEALERLKVNTPELFDKIMALTSGCDVCAKRDYEQRMEAIRLQRVRDAYSNGHLPDYAAGWTFENSVKAWENINPEAWKWARSTTGTSNAWICGATGRGKTYLVLAALNSLVSRGHKAAFIRAYDLSEAIFDRSANLLHMCRDCSPLCIDDMHNGRWNGTTLRGFLELMDKRSNLKLATWFTANVSGQAFFGTGSQLRKDNPDIGSILSPLAGRIVANITAITMDGDVNLRREIQESLI